MFNEHRAVAALRVFLVLLFGILVVFQVMSLPGQFAHMALLLFLMLIGVTVLGLLTVVMRALLRQATTLRTDMEAVI
jgi:hypothetical protein